jgi:hypothetical protein
LIVAGEGVQNVEGGRLGQDFLQLLLRVLFGNAELVGFEDVVGKVALFLGEVVLV